MKDHSENILACMEYIKSGVKGEGPASRIARGKYELRGSRGLWSGVGWFVIIGLLIGAIFIAC